MTVIETPEGPVPVPYPLGGNPPPLPHIANPLPELVYGAERRWDTVAGWVSNAWHKGVGFLEGAASITLGDVETIVDAAINASQTAWSSMISTLEAWVVVGIDEIADTITDVRLGARTQAIELGQMIESLGDEVLGWGAGWIAQAEAYADRVVDELARALLSEIGNVQQWVIDDIASPLLGELARVEADVRDELARALGDVETWVRDQLNIETLERVAALSALAAAVAEITRWMDECGEPLCNEFGPGSTAGQLLADADLLKLLGFLLALSALGDPKAVADAAVYVTRVLGPPIEAAIENWLEPLQAATPG